MYNNTICIFRFIIKNKKKYKLEKKTLPNSNGIRTHNHLVRKPTLNHLAN